MRSQSVVYVNSLLIKKKKAMKKICSSYVFLPDNEVFYVTKTENTIISRILREINPDQQRTRVDI